MKKAASGLAAAERTGQVRGVWPRRRAERLIIILVAVVSLSSAGVRAQDGSSTLHPPLTVSEVVHNLEGRNQERAQALRRFEGTRVYSIRYHGFPHSYEAGMVVNVTYQSPSSKEFTIVSETGSKFLIDRVLTKALESEKEAAGEPSRSALTEQNYEFTMSGYEATAEGSNYILSVTPRSANKFLYRGKIWVDAADFAVVKIEVEPAQNPSFWIKKTDVRHAYKKVDGFWLPAENHSLSIMRIGGHAELSIDYKDYKITEADPLPAAQAFAQGVPHSAGSR